MQISDCSAAGTTNRCKHIGGGHDHHAAEPRAAGTGVCRKGGEGDATMVVDLTGLADCPLCPRLCATRKNVALPRHARENPSVMVIGQAPGYNEDIKGQALIGRSGQVTDKLLSLHAGIDVDDVWFDNVVKCYPGKTPSSGGDKKPIKAEIEACTEAWLYPTIQALRPRLIITLGDVALKLFFPHETLSQVHGHRLIWTFPEESWNVVVMPSYHPAYAMRNPAMQEVLIHDFAGLREEAPPAAHPWTLTPLADIVDGLELNQLVALDYETTTPSIDGDFAPSLAEPIGVALATHTPEGIVSCYQPTVPTMGIAPLRPMLERADWPKVAHNLKFEWMVSARQGITLRGGHDTKLMAYLLDKPSNALKDLTGSELGIRQQHFSEWDGHSPEYPAADAAYTLIHFSRMREELIAEGMWDLYEQIELPVAPILGEMELTGVAVDLAEVARVREYLYQERNRLGAEFPWVYDIRKDEDIRTYLYEDLKLKVTKRTKTGLPSVEKGVLEALNHIEAAKILRWNELDGLITKYVDTLPRLIHKDGRVHGSFNQAGRYEDHEKEAGAPVTGRLSASRPNLQNIPHRTELGRRLRRVFVPREGWYFIKGDVGQEEARIGAMLAGDEALLRMFAEDIDVYLPIAQVIYDMTHTESERALTGPLTKKDKKWRDIAKIVYLLKQYKGQPAKIRESCAAVGILLTPRQAVRISMDFDERYPKLAVYADMMWQFLLEHGYVETYFHRRVWIPEAFSGDRQQQAKAHRRAANIPIQGTGADIMKIILRRVHDALEEHAAHLVLTVHDEVVVETHPSEVDYVVETLNHAADNILPIRLPMEVSSPAKVWD